MSKRKYPLRITRVAHGGIRAQAVNLTAHGVWWARRWLGTMESFRMGPRLGRGRSYALAGQVTELTCEGTHVAATIVGSRKDPYHVTVDFPELPQLKDLLTPILLARILADDLPVELEERLVLAGASLFSFGKMWCSCPDWHKPCKHVAAVLFLLGEEVARHPALLLELHGLDLESLVGPEIPIAPTDVQLPNNFSVALESDAAPLITRLGPVSFWRGSERFKTVFERIYSRVRNALNP